MTDTTSVTRSQDRARAHAERTAAQTQSQIALAQTQSQIALAEAEAKRRQAREDREARAAEQRQAREDKREEQRQARADKRARRLERQQAREEKRTQKAERRAERVARSRAKLQSLAANGSQLAATVVYGVALAAAMGGQISTAHAELGELSMIVWLPIGIVIAVFVEGAAVAAATTADRVRDKGGRPVLPVVLTWLFAAVAAAIQLYGHWEQPILAVVLMSATLTAVTVHEMQTRANAAIKQIDETRRPVRWGWRRWLVAPVQTGLAWRADILSRTTSDAAVLLADAARSRAAHLARRDRKRLTKRADRLRRAALAAGVADWVHLTVVVSDTPAGVCDRGDCPSMSGQYGCPGHTDWESRVQTDTRPALPDADASDSGITVPASWVTGQSDGTIPPLDVATLVSALDALSAPDTTPSDTPVSDSEVSEPDIDAVSDTDVSDGDARTDTSDTHAQTDSVRPKRTRRRRTPRQVSGQSDTVAASDAQTDSRPSDTPVSDIAAVAERLSATGELSVRRLSDAANVTRYQAEKWLKDQKESRHGD